MTIQRIELDPEWFGLYASRDSGIRHCLLFPPIVFMLNHNVFFILLANLAFLPLATYANQSTTNQHVYPFIADEIPKVPQPSIPDYPSEPPRLGEIYDTLPLLMNWKLAYLLGAITLCFVLTNYILDACEDHLDQNDKIDMAYSSQQHNEETVGLLAKDTDTIVSATGVYGALTKGKQSRHKDLI